MAELWPQKVCPNMGMRSAHQFWLITYQIYQISIFFNETKFIRKVPYFSSPSFFVRVYHILAYNFGGDLYFAILLLIKGRTLVY